MCSPVRFSSVASVVLLGLLAVGPVEAQSLLVNGSASATVPAAPDYAAEVKGDPWDFDQSSDYVYTYSLGATQTSYEYTAWQPYPTVQNGLFTGITREPIPSLQMLFGGVPGAMNAQQDTGLKRRSTRAATSRCRSGFVVRGRPALSKHSASAGRRACAAFHLVALSSCWPRGSTATPGRWTNQNPVGQQGAANDWQVYRVRLTDAQLFPRNRFNPTDSPWNGQVMGLNLSLGNGPAGSTVEMDWVRLTASRTVRLDWQGLGGEVVVTLTDGTQNLQVFPEDLTPGTRRTSPRASTGGFPDNSGITWDYGHLTPGTWTITARGAGTTRTATLVVDASPFFKVLNPDETGGEDMATTLIGDPWDLTNREDVFRFSDAGERAVRREERSVHGAGVDRCCMVV